MENWNYDLAKAHADSIEDVTTRRLTQFFLTQFFLLAFRGQAVPENGEIDLLYYAKITEEIVKRHDLIERCIKGEDLDSAWHALSDELENAARARGAEAETGNGNEDRGAEAGTHRTLMPSPEPSGSIHSGG